MGLKPGPPIPLFNRMSLAHCETKIKHNNQGLVFNCAQTGVLERPARRVGN